MLGRMLENLVPIHALGLFIVNVNGDVNQIVIFDYYDENRKCALSLMKASPIELRRLRERLISIMQDIVDEEVLEFNGNRVFPEVKHVEIVLKNHLDIVSIYYIIYFKAKLKSGVNIYEDHYEATKATYDYEAYWIFPFGVKVKDVVMNGEVRLLADNMVAVYVRKGTRLSGYEKIIFEMPG